MSGDERGPTNHISRFAPEVKAREIENSRHCEKSQTGKYLCHRSIPATWNKKRLWRKSVWYKKVQQMICIWLVCVGFTIAQSILVNSILITVIYRQSSVWRDGLLSKPMFYVSVKSFMLHQRKPPFPVFVCLSHYWHHLLIWEHCPF